MKLILKIALIALAVLFIVWIFGAFNGCRNKPVNTTTTTVDTSVHQAPDVSIEDAPKPDTVILPGKSEVHEVVKAPDWVKDSVQALTYYRQLAESLAYVLKTNNVYDTTLRSGEAWVRAKVNIRDNEVKLWSFNFHAAPQITITKETVKTFYEQPKFQLLPKLGIGAMSDSSGDMNAAGLVGLDATKNQRDYIGLSGFYATNKSWGAFLTYAKVLGFGTRRIQK